jgi:hypothetical protein
MISKWVGISFISLTCLYFIGEEFFPQKEIQYAWMTRIERIICHTVKKGETIEKLAQMYGSNPSRIEAKNGLLKNEILMNGEKVWIPVNSYQEKIVV